MFKLGNHVIDEILEGVATDFNETQIFYTLDQLSGANIAITSDPREIQDKNGNIIRRIYKSKNGEFTATNSMLHPAVMNAASGSDIEQATETAPIDMPKIVVVAPGTVITDATADANTVKVIGIYGNGANSKPLTAGDEASFDNLKFVVAGDTITLPATGTTEGVDYPVNYLVMYTRSVKSGIKLTNRADKFPSAVRLTLYASYVDPCSEELKPAYIVIPNFMPDPSVTINLDSENQELDFNGTLQVDYCSGIKLLYYIFYPDENIVETVVPDVEINDLTVGAEAGTTVVFGTSVSDIQSDVAISANNNITGTLKYIDSGEIADYWGAGNFIALKFTNLDPDATSVKVGLDPSEGSGLVEIINDPDKNGVFKITNKDTQVFKVVQTNGAKTHVQTFDLSGLVLENG